MTVDEGESIAAALLKTFRNIIIPSCELFNEYGLCTPVMKNDFVYGLKMIGQFFTSEFRLASAIRMRDMVLNTMIHPFRFGIHSQANRRVRDRSRFIQRTFVGAVSN